MESNIHVTICANARYVRFHRNDINVVTMLIAEAVLAKNSRFTLSVPFVGGGRFLQELNATTMKYPSMNRKMPRKVDMT